MGPLLNSDLPSCAPVTSEAPASYQEQVSHVTNTPSAPRLCDGPWLVRKQLPRSLSAEREFVGRELGVTCVGINLKVHEPEVIFVSTAAFHELGACWSVPVSLIAPGPWEDELPQRR